MIETFEFGRVAVIGDLLLDQYISGAVNRISPEAPVPVLLHARQHAVPGGAANVAANLAALSVEVALVGLVGCDPAADTLRGLLVEGYGLDCAGLVADPGWTTITKTRVLSGRQQIVRIDSEQLRPLGSGIEDALIDAAVSAIEGSDVLVCSDYGKGVLSDRVLRAVIDAGRSRGIPVVVDPKRRSFEAYRGATLVKPNRGELALATGLPVEDDAQIERAAAVAAAQFGGDVLVTRSEQGMSLCRADGRVAHAQARMVEVSDVSGAGDTVVATLAAVLSARQGLEMAMTIAGEAAAIAVGKLGTATVSRDELAQALREDRPGEGRLVSLPEAVSMVQSWRRHGARVVFTNGCFDLLHPGHVFLLEAAAQLGDRLVVALNSDASVRRLKGPSRPIQDEAARATVMGALRHVDLVVLFDDDTPLAAIEAIRPDVLVKGSDYTEDQVVGSDVVRAHGGRVALVDLVAGRSTTALVGRAGLGGDRTG